MDRHVLLERETAGLSVEVAYLAMFNTGALRVRYDGREAKHTVPLDKFQDAFDHPLLYLNDEQLQHLAIT